jgi:uncharacterized membrane protein
MVQNKFFQTLVAAILLATPLMYAGFMWDRLPNEVALHFGMDGQPNRYGPKSELLFVLGLLSSVGLLVWLLLTNIEKIDPKKSAAQSKDTMAKTAWGVVALMCVLGILIVNSALMGVLKGNLLFILLGFFFAYLGNLMHSIKPNYFFGIRVPWTLESASNWRQTHQLASKIWVVGGILIALLSLWVPNPYLPLVFVGCVLVMALIPVAYSYSIYKSEKAG